MCSPILLIYIFLFASFSVLVLESEGTPPRKSGKSKAEIQKDIDQSFNKTETLEDGTIVIKDTSGHSKSNHIHDRAGPQLGGLGKIGAVVTIVGGDQVAKTATVKFTSYTQQNPKKGQVVDTTLSLAGSLWNSSLKTYFYIHGYTQNSDEGSAVKLKYLLTSENMRDGFFCPTPSFTAFFAMNFTANIVIVDWHTASQQANYFAAAKDTEAIGNVVGDMIISLQLRGFLNYTQVVIVGFSLGGQIAGVAGYRVRKKTDQLVGRITALDPAGPGFDPSVNLNARLDKTDAEFVDVIHCNAGELLPYRHLGTTVICGHVDFFPNGGSMQPGCEYKDNIGGLNACSHMICPQIYATTIRGTVFSGCPCANNQDFAAGKCEVCDGPPMGYFCPTNATGVYYLKNVAPGDADKVDFGT